MERVAIDLPRPATKRDLWSASTSSAQVSHSQHFADTDERYCYNVLGRYERFGDVGTGGSVLIEAMARVLASVDSTGATWSTDEAFLQRTHAQPKASVSAPADIVADIRSAFGLNVADTARVLHVERPTIYSWLAAGSVPLEGNLRRLVLVGRLAQVWNGLSSVPAGALMRMPLPNQQSLFDELVSDDIDERTATSAMEIVAKQCKAKRRKSVRALAKARGQNLSEMEKQTNVIDSLTGKRVAPE